MEAGGQRLSRDKPRMGIPVFVGNFLVKYSTVSAFYYKDTTPTTFWFILACYDIDFG
jgi:hypothetical protein